jgi:DNA-directed RNA polymerase subunit beta
LVKKTERISFASVAQEEYPDFLDIQIKSFKDFFQLDTNPENRKKEGLYRVFKENFPISDARNSFVLEFMDYYVDAPRYSIEECVSRGLTYCVPLKAKMRLYCTDVEHEDFETIIQEVYLGLIPYMTPSGTFVINGAERVVVSQLHRSPGVFFGTSLHTNGTLLYSARIIPFKGSWIEFTTDISNVMYAYIDRKKKLPVTTLLRAIGYETDKDILQIFDMADEVKVNKVTLKKLVGSRLAARVVRTWEEDFVEEDTGEVVTIPRTEILIDREEVLEEKHFNLILDNGIKSILIHKNDENAANYSIIYNTLQKDPANSEKQAIEYIYFQLRSAAPPDEETARMALEKLFFSEKRYDLGEVGRYRINRKLGLTIPMETRILTKEDIISIIKHLIELINSRAEVDDIDHLSNRRVRTVGEQLANQFSMGLLRMSRTIRDRMNVRDSENFNPIDLVNSKTLTSVINSFFGTNQLSQFMDQTNPLAEITHKRRISALGQGGLSRERAGFEVRDVHYTHYGRLCTIETPEGPNIGLISSLCVFAKINHLGFIETPYRRVVDGKVCVKEPFVYLGAEEDQDLTIAQATTHFDPKTGEFLQDRIKARHEADYPIVSPNEIDALDIAPNQIASIAASLIPFLEHDDANRALMGSNMMRQAVPLLRAEAPIVGTGLEEKLARASRTQIYAEGKGIVEYVDANRMEIRYDFSEDDELASFDSNLKEYTFTKNQRTNQSTVVNIQPIVRRGDKVVAGQCLTEGYATKGGELALGRNLKVAFMPWKGYNFEDAIVISEKVVKEDWFTSIHVDEYMLEVRDTKRGAEELTCDIPNVSSDTVKNLDSSGVVCVGTHIKEGDILIGKITPKGESYPTPEEKLLRAIFGDKAGDVKDASLKAPPSTEGIVLKNCIFERKVKNRREKNDDKKTVKDIEDDLEKKSNDLKNTLVAKLYKLTEGRVSRGISDIFGNLLIPKGPKFSQKALAAIDYLTVDLSDWTADESVNRLVERIVRNYCEKYRELVAKATREKFTLTIGEELPAGIVKMAKVYIVNKRKLRVGDKMAGRHGNKGIVAKIVREEDMPFMEDGTPVDIVLNPLGVPSRMNIGQIYETILGWAGHKLGLKFATPIFDGATLEQVNSYLKKADLPENGSVYLYDGGTGERFEQPVTVGYIYMLKLHHMVDDKMHARSIGPYSLITQQPLGGKAQFGGQRFGEMEVWALEAFGAANILQEILTVKSDDVNGRAKMYEAIVKGDVPQSPGLPESFNVLVNELRSLALEVTFE